MSENQTTTSESKATIERLDSYLDGYERKLGLPDYEPDNSVHYFLKLSRDSLQRLTPDECGEGSYILRKYSFFLQRAYGRESARVKYLDRQLRKVIASEVGQYRAASADERRELAIKGNDTAKELSRQRDVYEARLERISFLSNSIGYLAGSLEELQQTKRRQRP